MNPALKQRLVGALVLVSAGVLLWPLIMGSDLPEPERLELNLPTAPLIVEPVMPKPEQLKKNLPTYTKPASKVDRPSSTAPSGKLKEVNFDQDGLPQRWAVQAGVFSEVSNASKLLVQSRGAGLIPQLRPFRKNGKQLHRVLVGPYLRRGDGEKAAAKVAALSGEKPAIVTYQNTLKNERLNETKAP